MPPDEHPPTPTQSSGLTFQQATQLLKDVRETRETVVEIKAGCKPCREQVGRLTRTIDGNDGKGIKGRLLLVEQARKASEENNTQSEIRYAAMVEKQMKWSRGQIKAVIVALLSFVGMAAGYFFGG